MGLIYTELSSWNCSNRDFSQRDEGAVFCDRRLSALRQHTHARTSFVPPMFRLATACSALATHCATLFYMPDYRTSSSLFIGCSCSCSFTTTTAAGYSITAIWCTCQYIQYIVLSFVTTFLPGEQWTNRLKKKLLEASIAVVSKLIWNNISLIVFLFFSFHWLHTKIHYRHLYSVWNVFITLFPGRWLFLHNSRNKCQIFIYPTPDWSKVMLFYFYIYFLLYLN